MTQPGTHSFSPVYRWAAGEGNDMLDLAPDLYYGIYIIILQGKYD